MAALDEALLHAAVGLFGGIVAGLFGVGGGIVAVPLLLLFGEPFLVAKTGAQVMLLMAGARGVMGHAGRGVVAWTPGLALAAGGVVSTIAASVWSFEVPESALARTLGAVLVLTAIRLVAREPPSRAVLPAWVVGAAAGIVGGILTGLLGIGGGIVAVPLLVLLGGLPIHTAVGTSLVGVATNGIVGTATHAALGHGETLLHLGVPLGLGAVVGAPAGVWAAHRLQARSLRLTFAALLVVAAARLLIWA